MILKIGNFDPIMKTTLIKYVAAGAMMLCAAGAQAVTGAADLLPRPSAYTQAKGTFDINRADAATFAIKGTDNAVVKQLLVDAGLTETSWNKAAVRVECGRAEQGDDYTLTIAPKRVTIKSRAEAGAFYGVQSLVQLVAQARQGDGLLECGEVKDSPRFQYRGLHFDVSRHFRGVDFLKKQIDAMASLKMNKMHLHLTDGAGWRMPIDKYPRLTGYAAWRPQRSWDDWRKNGNTYCDESDPRASGGYYTKEQLRDLIDYAAARHITIIPEIEMPGHSEEVLAAYPELSCKGDGKGSDLCPGKEATFQFLEDVLLEVMDVFPSHYIHIGGDEASKGQWRDCPDCKARMEVEGLKDVDELQSYLIKRIERFVNSHGREIIGWDEILQGGVAPGATVMSWRGTEGGIQSLKSGHDVVMTPGEFCYIDYSQDAPFREPASIGGYTPLSKVYSYEPVEPVLTPEEASHLLGVQANLWSEYVTEDSHAEYMYYPRAYAIAEIGWSTPEKDYPDFHRRALAFNERMKARGYNTFDLANEYGQRRESLDTLTHLGRGAKVIYGNPYSKQYAAAGESTLTDGIRGGWANGDKRWQGFLTDVDVTIDLGEVKPIHTIATSFFHSEGAWIHLPECVTFSVSDDGETFTEVGRAWVDVDPLYNKIFVKDYFTIANTQGRYVRVQAEKNPREGAWLFLDEVVVN